MKVLLLGEFSGVHTNLKEGLVGFGHDVKLASDGDGYRNFSSDISITPFKSKYIGKILNLLYFIVRLHRFIGYDVVQFINPFVFPYYFHYLGLPKLVFMFNKKTIYYVCGTDPAFLTVSDKLSYFTYDDPASKEYPDYGKKNKLNIHKSFIKDVDVIVPSMYGYYLAYADSPKVQEPIPLPGAGKYIDCIKPLEGKLKILFGITRPGIKGADHILKALEEIKSKHSDKVEITVVSKLPYNEYEVLLSQTDVLIDQCKSYSYGMNAIHAMEKGVIVLSGSEQIAMEYLGVLRCPVINITPDVKQIIDSIEDIITTEAFYQKRIKREIIKYVIKNHNHKIIAQKIINIYKPGLAI
jgi:hypothetical protein